MGPRGGPGHAVYATDCLPFWRDAAAMSCSPDWVSVRHHRRTQDSFGFRASSASRALSPRRHVKCVNITRGVRRSNGDEDGRSEIRADPMPNQSSVLRLPDRLNSTRKFAESGELRWNVASDNRLAESIHAIRREWRILTMRYCAHVLDLRPINPSTASRANQRAGKIA